MKNTCAVHPARYDERMFDIMDYLPDNDPAPLEGRCVDVAPQYADDEIAVEIDALLAARFDPLYQRDKFKVGAAGVEIIHPALAYPGRRALVKGPDYVRFLLSLYPQKSDLESVEKIVLRPRHVELGDIELMALYLRNRRILVLYLYVPHFYVVGESKFREYAEFAPCKLNDIVGGSQTGPGRMAAASSTVKVPPLWYILSMISPSPDPGVDKFLVKKEREHYEKISAMLDEVSYFYARHGY